MTRERLNQIRKAIDFDPSSAESYTDELIRAVDQYIRDSHAQSGALREARAEVERLKRLSDTMQDLADGDCAYGDNCPSNAGTRHGTCDQCKAREALNKAGIPLRACEVTP